MIDFKHYLISFLATIQGHRAVISGLTGMQTGMKGYGTTTTVATAKTNSFSQALLVAGKRALYTIPLWLLLRTAFMGLIRTISGIITAQMDLEDGMARIRTVMQGSASVISAQMTGIKRSIVDMSAKTSLSFKELSEAFYFLKTSSLTAVEAMSAFEPTVNAMLGTGSKAKEMARAIAGAYNTMGQFMEKTLTTSEKMVRIADILTYTYATQDVEMSELISGYEKIAPYTSGLSDSFADIVTIMGVLNTHLLRGSRTGRLLGRTILQLTKNADKLARVFGIVFKPDEPMNLVKVFKEMSKYIEQNVQLSFEQSKALQEIFATRGAIAPRLLLPIFKEVAEAIEQADISAEGFAQRMADIRELTLRKQMQRLGNVLNTLAFDFMSGAYGISDMAIAMRELNDTLLKSRQYWQDYGIGVGYILDTISQSALAWEALMKRMMFGWMDDVRTTYKAFIRDMAEAKIGVKHPDIYILDRLKVAQTAQVAKKLEQEQARLKLKMAGEETQQLKHQVNLLKAMGANELDIAKYNLEQAKLKDKENKLLVNSLDTIKAQNKLEEERLKYANERIDMIRTAEINMLKTVGASELQILELKSKQLEMDKQIIGEAEYLMRFEDLRLQRALALQDLKQKELDTATNLYMQYYKADEMERERIRRMMELEELDPRALAKVWKTDMYDRGIIEQYFSHFSEKGQQAIGKILGKEFGLPGKDLFEKRIDEISKTFEKKFSPTLAEEFGNAWETRIMSALGTFKKEWLELAKTEFLVPGGGKMREGKAGFEYTPRKPVRTEWETWEISKKRGWEKPAPVSTTKPIKMEVSVEAKINFARKMLEQMAEGAGSIVWKAILEDPDKFAEFIKKIDDAIIR